MSKLSDFLTGNKVIAEFDSPINGKISVIKSLGYGVHVQVGGLTQSGGVVKDVWKSTLKKTKGLKIKAKNCLILGLGAGSAAKLVRSFWPDCKITGVEIDPIFIDIGKKYFGLKEFGLEVINDDATNFIKKALKKKVKYGLVLVDMYVGDNVPKKFEKEAFVRQIKKLMTKDGRAVFNRLYYGEKRRDAQKFLNLLEKNFVKVIPHYPEANVMYICSKS